jgi:nitroimidazol reductase NimA-like FMN-containing flavoprotein (pyridoxamine 5'-phosphate oxidase superfamily)
MSRSLTDLEIRQLLQNQHYGHISCCTDPTRPYVIPVTYVYKDNVIYCHSFIGKKIEIMREQPSVCFQVEELISDTSWQSAICWGDFKELTGDDRKDGFTLLIEKFWSAYNKKASIYFPFRSPDTSLDEKDLIVFAIHINSQVGKFEEYEN